jgi:hypothetical protein
MCVWVQCWQCWCYSALDYRQCIAWKIGCASGGSVSEAHLHLLTRSRWRKKEGERAPRAPRTQRDWNWACIAIEHPKSRIFSIWRAPERALMAAAVLG